MIASNRLMFNTMVMYAKYAITIAVSLFSSRWVLLALGEEDFGIFSLVAGLLAMLQFLNVTMASSTQRFMSYAAGTKDMKLMKVTFYNSLLIHFIIGIVILALFETVGMLLLHHVLSIPLGKMHLAEFVLHCMSVGTFVTIVCVPFYAALLTHENILFFSIVQVTESILHVTLAYWLLYIASDRLKIYAVATMLLSIMVSSAYVVYVRRNYAESRVGLRGFGDRRQLKEFLAYSSWNLIGGISSVLRTQGVAMLLNSFFGVIINAAWGIAYRINGQLRFFSSAIVTAARPQIVKSEGSGNRQRMLALSMTTCKITFLLLSLISVPLILEMPYILEIWLKEVPGYTVLFSRFIVLLSLIFQLSIGVGISIESVGNIKMVQLIVGGLHFIVLPVGYVLLKMGCQPYAVCIVMVAEESLAFCFRLLIARRVSGLPVSHFVLKVVIPSVSTVAMVFGICLYVKSLMETGFLRLVLICIISSLLISLLTYRFLLFDNERAKVKAFCNSALGKIGIHRS